MERIVADRRMRNALIGLESRTQALFAYGALALFVGVLMAVSGAPTAVEAKFGTLIRLELGIPLAIGGALVTVSSSLAGERRWAWWSALLGMILLTLWCLAMTVAYTIGGLDQGFVVAGPMTEIPIDRARAYVPFLYQGLMVLALLHVITFLRMGRPPR